MGTDYSLNIGMGCTLGELFNIVTEKKFVKYYSDRTGEQLKDREIEVEYLVPLPDTLNAEYFMTEKFQTEDLWQVLDGIEVKYKIRIRVMTGSGEWPNLKDIIGVVFPEKKDVIDDWSVALNDLPFTYIEDATNAWYKLFPNKTPRMFVGLSVSY